ncbi:UDP-N-acetylmuramoyl-tripeptide--D-alanyl-D-alanine ligase [Patescibacteria group bacterium]|nr:UDP-N-acetylmuramoyl-tripeptide--D-alanyl-D-alanine ligase [Patescibacteria group bacterium]
MLIFLLLIIALFFIKLLRDSLFFVWLWQVKEYRIDRMISYLKSKKEILKNNLFYILIFILFVSYFIFLKNYPLVFQYLALIFFASSFAQTIMEIKNRTLKRPKNTFKIKVIYFLLVLVYFSYFICWNSSIQKMGNLFEQKTALLILFILLSNTLVISAIIFLINPFFNYKKQKIIMNAIEKMKRLKKIKVIGITGSYGKTSTKEFLYTILSSKYKVVKTEGNNNTNIGVAYTVLNKVSDEYDYFICEMGAYKIAEITEICSIVNPKIGILTGINEQHIELFGSIENTRKAKFELIEALPDDGFALLNENIQSIKPEVKVKDIQYFSKGLANEIKYINNNIEFKYKNQAFQTNILGKHYIENIISAIMVAEHLGMKLDEIAREVEKIKPTEYMMRKLKGLNNSVFIDDSYSANPDGVLAALDYLSDVDQDYQKIIVFPGIIELGKKSDEIHRKLFIRINQVCDVAYIMNSDLKDIIDEMKEINCKYIFENDFEKVSETIRKDLKEKTAILFESRGAGVVMRKLKK